MLSKDRANAKWNGPWWSNRWVRDCVEWSSANPVWKSYSHDGGLELKLYSNWQVQNVSKIINQFPRITHVVHVVHPYHIPVGLVVWEGGHDPEVDLGEGHLLVRAETVVNSLFFPTEPPNPHKLCLLPWVDGHGDKSDIGVGWFLGGTECGCSGRLLAHLQHLLLNTCTLPSYHRCIPAILPPQDWVVSGDQPGFAGRVLPLPSCRSQGVETFQQADFLVVSCWCCCRKVANCFIWSGVASKNLQLGLSDAKWQVGGWGGINKQAFGREQSPPLEEKHFATHCDRLPN